VVVISGTLELCLQGEWHSHHRLLLRVKRGGRHAVIRNDKCRKRHVQPGGNLRMNIAQHLAATLKHLRQQRGWSLSRLAEETGVSKALILQGD
jgi:ribosome-binding protein aMBF1 (putative translation factor)